MPREENINRDKSEDISEFFDNAETTIMNNFPKKQYKENVNHSNSGMESECSEDENNLNYINKYDENNDVVPTTNAQDPSEASSNKTEEEDPFIDTPS